MRELRQLTSFAIVLIAFLSLMVVQSSSVQAQSVLSGLTAGAGTELLDDVLEDRISQATDSGEWLIGRLGIELRLLLEEWRRVNEDLLDTAFDRLDQSQRNFLLGVESLAYEASGDLEERMADVESIVRTTNASIHNTYLSKGFAYIDDYSPILLMPNHTGDVVMITFRGINLENSDPAVSFGEFETGDIINSSSLGFTASIPAELFGEPDPEELINRHVITVSFDNRRSGILGFLGLEERVDRQFTVLQLPQSPGTYRLTGEKEYEKRFTETYETQTERHGGRGESKEIPFKPKAGWKWLLEDRGNFRCYTSGADRGRCRGSGQESIDWNRSTELEVFVKGRFDERGEWPNRRAGWANIGAVGTIYQHRETTEPLGIQEGSLSWNRDIVIDLPEHTERFALVINTIDGREVVVTESSGGNDPYFRVSREPTRIIIRPNIPSSSHL